MASEKYDGNYPSLIMPQPRIAILGDLILDVYTHGNVVRISPEAPVPVLKVSRKEQRLGGSGNVLLNLCDLQTTTIPFGRIGNDLNGKLILDEMKKKGVTTENLLQSSNLPTITKNRFVAQHQQMIRVDEEQVLPLENEEEETVLAKFKSHVDSLDVVILSDYDKGFLTDRLIRDVIDISRKKGVPVIVDPKGDDFSRYRGATVITPNFKEAKAAAPKERTLEDIAEVLISEAKLDFLMITRSSEGISHFTHLEDELTHLQYPVEVQDVIDVTGAGDTVIAVCAYGLSQAWSTDQLCIACNLAGGEVVGHFGAATISHERLLDLMKAENLFD